MPLTASLSSKEINLPLPARLRSDFPMGWSDRHGEARMWFWPDFSHYPPPWYRTARFGLYGLLALCLATSIWAFITWPGWANMPPATAAQAIPPVEERENEPVTHPPAAEQVVVVAPAGNPIEEPPVEKPVEPDPVAASPLMTTGPAFDLQPAESSNNLDSIDAEENAPQPALIIDTSEPVAPVVAGEESSAEAVREPEEELTLAEEPPELLVPRANSGEGIMIRNWKLLGWQSTLAALLAAAPAAAQEPNDIILKKIDKLQLAVETMQKSMDGKITQMQEDVKKLGAGILNNRTGIDLAHSEIKTLKQQIAQLQKDISQLRQQQKRVSLSPPETKLGRIRLVNTYPQQMTVIVNQTAYRLLPNESRLIDNVPIGAFTYQVLGVQTAPRNIVLAAKETFTITVFPQ